MAAVLKEIRVGQFINTPAGLAVVGGLFLCLIVVTVEAVVVGFTFFRAGYFLLFSLFLMPLVIFLYLAGTLVVALKKAFRNKDKPIILFERDGFSYFSKDFLLHQHIAYADIAKIYKPIVKKRMVDEICIRKIDGVELVIVANGLVLDSRGIFSIFVERCPNLRRPYSTVMLLK
jgi:hypothetical protein